MWSKRIPTHTAYWRRWRHTSNTHDSHAHERAGGQSRTWCPLSRKRCTTCARLPNSQHIHHISISQHPNASNFTIFTKAARHCNWMAVRRVKWKWQSVHCVQCVRCARTFGTKCLTVQIAFQIIKNERKGKKERRRNAKMLRFCAVPWCCMHAISRQTQTVQWGFCCCCFGYCSVRERTHTLNRTRDAIFLP